MNTVFPRASLKRSPRTRARKDSISGNTDADIICADSPSSPARPKTRPPPLQIIPELSETELDFDTRSPTTARPTRPVPQQRISGSSRITLSAYTFSIDDALLMFGDDAPRSPALSFSSSTSSEDVLATPGISDDEDEHGLTFPTPYSPPRRISIRPLCIAKTHSLVCNGDEDIQKIFEQCGEDSVCLPATKEEFAQAIEVGVATGPSVEPEQDFYVRETEKFLSFSPISPFPSSPARRDSLTLVTEALPNVANVTVPKLRGRSRLSKPLPLLPPVTPPVSTFPTFPLLQTTAQNSVVRRKRYIHPVPAVPPLPSRPLPRMAIPFDVDDSSFRDDNFDEISNKPIVIEQTFDAEDDASIYSQPFDVRPTSTPTHMLPVAIAETPLSGIHDEASLHRFSTDSDASRSSVDSASSFASTTSADTPILAYTFPVSPVSEDDEHESTQRLRSRWSSSTLATLAAEPPRANILSPIKSVLNSRTSRPHSKPPKKAVPPLPSYVTFSKNKRGTPTSPSSRIRSKHVRQQDSQSSTSSAGISSSESDNGAASPTGLKRMPIPLLMFLRGT